jgi:cell division septal protein FtsQ
MKNRKRRGSSRYYLYFMFSLLGLAVVGLGIYFLLINLPALNLKQIQVSGNAAVSDSLILSVAKPCIGQNLLAISKGELRKRYSKYARIKSVRILRKYPSTLAIQIVERKGFLYLKTVDGDLCPIDEDCVVLEKYSNVYSEDLPVVSTFMRTQQLKPGLRLNKPYLNRIMNVHKQILTEAPEFAPTVSEYYVVDNTVYMIDSRLGTRIIPSPENLAKQLKRYQFVQDNGNINPHSVVDLRFSNQVVVKAGN